MTLTDRIEPASPEQRPRHGEILIHQKRDGDGIRYTATLFIDPRKMILAAALKAQEKHDV